MNTSEENQFNGQNLDWAPGTNEEILMYAGVLSTVRKTSQAVATVKSRTRDASFNALSIIPGLIHMWDEIFKNIENADYKGYVRWYTSKLEESFMQTSLDAFIGELNLTKHGEVEQSAMEEYVLKLDRAPVDNFVESPNLHNASEVCISFSRSTRQ